MAKAEINPGVCGMHTTIVAKANGDGRIHLAVESECEAVRKLVEQLKEVDPFQEFSWRGKPQTHALAPKCLFHSACPVPSGIIKVIEIEAGLALPADVTIKLSA